MLVTLATEVDFVTLGSLILAFLTTAGTGIATCWVGIRKICSFLWKYFEPKVEEFAKEQISLVRNMRDNVPIVRDTMKALATNQEKLVDSQIKQNTTLQMLSEASDRHEELHAETGKKLDQIIGHLSNRDIPTQH